MRGAAEPQTGRIVGYALVALVTLLLFPGCKRRKYVSPYESPSQAAAPAESSRPQRPSEDAPPPVPSDASGTDALVRAIVRMNNKPVPTWADCTVTVWEPESRVSTLTRGSCKEYARFRAGRGDVEVTVRAGNIEAAQRFETRDFKAGTENLDVALTWPAGRLKVRPVAGCTVSSDLGDLADWTPAKAGDYTLHFTCAGFKVDGKATVAVDMDNELSPGINAPSGGRPPTIMEKIVPGSPLQNPSTPQSSEQIKPVGTPLPNAPGQDLAAPKEAALPDPVGNNLQPPKGEDLPPATRENP